MTLWNTVMEDVLKGGSLRTEELIGHLCDSAIDRGAVFQSSAYIVMTYDPARAVLVQRYALEQYRARAQWMELIACAHESLFFSSLRLSALSSLLDAVLHLEDAVRITRYGEFVCQQHASGFLTQGQLCSLFFNSVVPYYHKQLKKEWVLLLRRTLHAYNQEYSDLLYAYLQANLYSYTTDMAQQLIGERDVLARS